MEKSKKIPRVSLFVVLSIVVFFMLGLILALPWLNLISVLLTLGWIFFLVGTLPKKLRRLGYLSFYLGMLVFVFSVISLNFFLIEIPIQLLFGWIFFLVRTLPKVTLNWSVLSFGVFYLIAAAVVAHYFCSWLYNSIQRAKQPEQAHRRDWKYDWTAALLGGMFLLFFTAMAFVGTAHQVVWLFTSDEPWISAGSTHSEAVTNLNGIKLAQESYRLTNGTYLSCAPSPRSVEELYIAGQKAVEWKDADPDTGFSATGFATSSKVRCVYAVTATSATTFVAEALYDTDGDGNQILFVATERRGPHLIGTDPDDANLTLRLGTIFDKAFPEFRLSK